MSALSVKEGVSNGKQTSGGGSSPHSKRGQTTTEYAVIAALALAVVAGLLVFASAMKGNISDAGNGVADTFAALSGENGGGGGSGGESDEPAPDPNGIAFAVYSADDQSLDFYKRDRLPEVGSTFCGKAVTEIFEGIESLEIQPFYLAPWANNGESPISNISAIDYGISPCNLNRWFAGMHSLVSCDLRKINVSKITNMESVFAQLENLENLDISSWDLSNVTSMNYMFYQCKSLSRANLGGLNVSKVKSMNSLFEECTKLESLDLSSWDTSSLASLEGAFSYCENLSTLSISGWNVSSVTSFRGCFKSCKSLTRLDLSSWDTMTAENLEMMFRDCENLSRLDISMFDSSNIKTANDCFYNCESLSIVSVGSNWKWISGAQLPTPSKDGLGPLWFSESGQGYWADSIPSNVQDTYYASKWLVGSVE